MTKTEQREQDQGAALGSDGQVPASTETHPDNFERAVWLCRALKAYPMPHILPGGDGAVGLDWDEGATRVLSVTLDNRRWVGYSYLVGEHKACGRVAEIAAVGMLTEVLRLIYPEVTWR